MIKRSLPLACALGMLAAACSDEETTPLSEIVSVRDATDAECDTGGQTILVGTDTNGDGMLSANEVRNSASVCNGDQGETGEQGVPGTSALINATPEPAGANCTGSGVRVEVGLDDNGDGTLQAEEIDVTSFVCNGSNGLNSLTRTSTGAVGCGDGGGVLIESGLDDNGDGMLSADEVDSADSVCNGNDGATSLVSVADEPAGMNCAAGGQRVTSGVDENGDGQLTGVEIGDVSFICNAVNNLVSVSAELAGTSTICASGGSRISVGLDTNANGTLDGVEITQVSFSCNGDGSLVSVNPEPAGANCANGGQRVDAGTDTNGNGALDAGEVTSTTYVCDGANGVDGADGANGANGSLALVSTEPPGTNCLNGGVRVDSGPDLNFNGVLDAGEITATAYACDGEARESLITSTAIAPGPECTNGGFRIDAGLDANGNGTLDTAEITTTSFVCNGLASVPFAIQTASLPDGQANQPYSATLTAAGGTGGSYSWSISDGALPDGLVLAPTGTPDSVLSGSPTRGGTFTFTVQVTDFFGQAASRQYTIEIDAPALEITSFVVPRLDPPNPYNFTLSATGGSAPYTWSIAQGSLPPGLSLSASGAISGTPSANMPVEVLVRVTDAVSDEREARLEFRNRREWVGFTGDLTTDDVGEAYAVNISGTTPGMAMTINPQVTNTTGDVGQISTPSFKDVVWSPDGTKATIIGDLETEGSEELWWIDLTASTPTPVKGHPDFTSSDQDVDTDDIFWSPDSRYFGFIADNATNSEWNLFLVDTTTTAVGVQVNGTLPTSGDVDISDGFRFSPDSTKLAYISDENTAAVETLFVVDLTASTLSPVQVSGGASTADVTNFLWTADSRNLIFLSDEGTDGLSELWISDVSGTAPTVPVRVNAPLTNATGDVGATVSFDQPSDYGVSPDGRRLYYIADAVTESVDELYVVDLDNLGVARRVSPAGLTSTSQDVDRAFFTPDSQSLVFVADTVTINELEVFLVDATGANMTGPVTLNAPLPTSGDVSTSEIVADPQNRGVFFEADALVNDEQEVFFVDFLSPGTMVNLLPGIGSGQDTNTFLVANNGNAVVINADLNQASTNELFLVDVSQTPFRSAEQVNGSLTSGGSVSSGATSTSRNYDIVGDGEYILYIADQDVDNENAPYIVPVSGNSPGSSTALITPVTGGDAANVHF